MEESEVILVPKDRVGAIAGRKGSTKLLIENKTATRLEIDSEQGEVEIFREGEPHKYLKAMRIIKAIARGFNPEKALRLLKDDVVFELIDLKEILGKGESTIRAKKGRVIGKKGKARDEIEQDTGANISVYGKTIGIIGTFEETQKARRAVEMLLGGASHSMAFSSLKNAENEEFEL